MTRFQVVADYLKFQFTQCQMKFYDFFFVCVCVYLRFQKFLRIKIWKLKEKNWNFILRVTQNPVITSVREKSVREKKSYFQRKSVFWYEKFWKRRERVWYLRKKTARFNNSAPRLQSRWPHSFPSPFLPASRYPSNELGSRAKGMWIKFCTQLSRVPKLWNSLKLCFKRTLHVLYSICVIHDWTQCVES